MFIHSPGFKKGYVKLSRKLRDKVLERLDVLAVDEHHVQLNGHGLYGKYEGCRSINVSGDVRVIYRRLSESIFHLLAVGTHSQLYD